MPALHLPHDSASYSTVPVIVHSNLETKLNWCVVGFHLDCHDRGLCFEMRGLCVFELQVVNHETGDPDATKWETNATQTTTLPALSFNVREPTCLSSSIGDLSYSVWARATRLRVMMCYTKSHSIYTQYHTGLPWLLRL